MENKKFFIRVESNEKIGTGHLMRCLTIANSLRKMGNQVHFISKNMSKESKELLESNKFSVNLLDYKRKKFDYEIDAKFTIEIIKKERKNSTFLIIDNYEIDKKWEILVKKFVKKIVVIDDLANRKHSCELLIDQNLNSDIKEKQYKKLTPKNCILLIGTQFAILRPEFYKLRKLTKTRTKIKNILISYGGTDPTNETIKVLKALKNLNLKNINTHIVSGNLNSKNKEIKKLSTELNKSKFYEYTKDIGKLMIKADIAFGGAGTTSWERCCLGLPAIITILSNDQKDIAESLEKNACGINLGFGKKIRVKDYENILRKFNWNNLREFSSNCKKIVDGRGTNRVISEILSM